MARDRPRNDTWATRSIRLPEDVTLDLFDNPYQSAYRFLHKSGEYHRIADSENTKEALPVTVGNWPEALLYASQNDAAYIVNFKEKRVYWRCSTVRGAPIWMPTAPIPHAVIEDVNGNPTPYEPMPDGLPPPRRPQLSGAQKRKRVRGLS